MLTFIITDVKVLVSEVVLLLADHIVDYLPIHVFRGSEVHIVVLGILSLASLDEPEGVDLDQFDLGEGIPIDKLHLHKWSFLN